MQNFTAKLPKVYQEDINIQFEFESCMRDLFRENHQRIIGKLTQRPLRMWGEPLHLDVQKDKHLHSLR